MGAAVVADRYTFTGKDGVERTFVGNRPPTPEEMAGIEQAESGGKPSGLDRLLALLPSAGGVVGGMTGGIGGAAGEGYGQLLKHARELPGAAADVASNLISQPGATLRGAVSGALEGAKDSGIQGGLQALYELGGKAVTAGLSTAGRAVYRGYLKPSLSGPLLDKASEIVETGIREALPVTDAGAAKAAQLTTELKGEVERILANTKGEVNLSDVADQVRAFAKRKYFMPGKPTADYEAAMKVADELGNHPSTPVNPFDPSQPVTANLSRSNAIKTGLDESVGESNFGVDRGATKTAQKVARRGVRQAIEAQAPEVGPLNARESKLIDLSNALDKATGREGNRNQLFGMPAIAAGATGAAELAAGAGRYGAGAMALATRIGLSPAVASRAAILAARMGDQMPGTAVADIARMAVEAAKATFTSQSEQ